jgi:nitrogen fixation protein FixH
MSQKTPAKPFTGKHMAIIMVAGFGIVMAVNFTMAAFAIGGFHGVVVENSYVASQKFNGWLKDAEKSRALGWEVSPARGADDHVVLTTQGVPAGTGFTAALRRPLGDAEFADLTFRASGDGVWRSDQPILPGRWLIRLSATADGDVWTEERELP